MGNKMIEDQRGRSLESFMEVEETCNRTMCIKQETNYNDECKFKIEDNGAEFEENSGEDMEVKYALSMNTIKQEVTELDDLNAVDSGMQSLHSQYEDVDNENLSEEVSSANDIIIKEEPLLGWVDLGKYEITQIIEEHSYCKSNVDSRSTHISKNYKCSDCTYQTKYKRALKYHIKIKHDVKATLLRCNNCFFQTKCKASLISHIKKQHNKHVLYECSKCKFITKYLQNLRYHEAVKHSTSEIFYCAQCFYKTNYKLYLIRHMKRQHDETSVIYNPSYQTKWENHLTSHNTLRRNENTVVYKCPKCSYETGHQRLFNRHTSMKHDNNTAIYRCSKCDYGTGCKRNLTVHNTVYHDKNGVVYKCSKCHFHTRYKGSFTQHYRLQHGKKCSSV